MADTVWGNTLESSRTNIACPPPQNVWAIRPYFYRVACRSLTRRFKRNEQNEVNYPYDAGGAKTCNVRTGFWTAATRSIPTAGVSAVSVLADVQENSIETSLGMYDRFAVLPQLMAGNGLGRASSGAYTGIATPVTTAGEVWAALI